MVTADVCVITSCSCTAGVYLNLQGILNCKERGSMLLLTVGTRHIIIVHKTTCLHECTNLKVFLHAFGYKHWYSLLLTEKYVLNTVLKHYWFNL